MNLKKVTFVAFILSLIILLFKFIVSSFGNDLFFWLWLDMDLRIFDLPIWFEIYGPSIMSILQFLPLIPFLYVFYKRQNRTSMNINKRNLVLVLLSVVVLTGVIFIGNSINQKHTYDAMISKADSAMVKENYGEAISLYESSLLIKQVPSVTNSIQLAKGLVEDRRNYDEANTKMDQKKYVEAIDQFSKTLGYKDVQLKIDECNKLLTAENALKAEQEAIAKQNEDAIAQKIAQETAQKAKVVVKTPVVISNSKKVTSPEQAVALVLKTQFNNQAGYEAVSWGIEINKGVECYMIKASNMIGVSEGGNGSAGIFAVDISTGHTWAW